MKIFVPDIPYYQPKAVSSCQKKQLRGGRASASLQLCAAETQSSAEALITIQVDVVDAHFACFNTIYYLLKARVFDLQSITD